MFAIFHDFRNKFNGQSRIIAAKKQQLKVYACCWFEMTTSLVFHIVLLLCLQKIFLYFPYLL